MFSPVLFGVRGVDVDLDVSVFVPSIRARSQVKPTGTRERAASFHIYSKVFIHGTVFMVRNTHNNTLQTKTDTWA